MMSKSTLGWRGVRRKATVPAKVRNVNKIAVNFTAFIKINLLEKEICRRYPGGWFDAFIIAVSDGFWKIFFRCLIQ